MTYLKLLMTSIFWGGTFIAGKMITQTVHPFSAAFLRFFIASLFLVVLTRKIEGQLPRPKFSQIPIIFCLGLTGIFSYNLFFFTGLKHIQANQASLIIACNPILISLCSVIFFKDRFTLLKIFGLCLSVAGAMVVISKGHLLQIVELGLGKGELLILGCVASWVAYSILGKVAMNALSPVASVCYSSITGTLLLFFPAVFNGLFKEIGTYGLTDWSSLFYLGFFGTVLGFYWYYDGIRQIGPMKAGIFINFVPISAIIFSYLILNEQVTPSLLIGATCVITGVYLTNKAKN